MTGKKTGDSLVTTGNLTSGLTDNSAWDLLSDLTDDLSDDLTGDVTGEGTRDLNSDDWCILSVIVFFLLLIEGEAT